MSVLFIRDKDGSLTTALDREMLRRKFEDVPLPDRQALIKETLWAAIHRWEDPRRGAPVLGGVLTPATRRRGETGGGGS